jgi:hypothetical protein
MNPIASTGISKCPDRLVAAGVAAAGVVVAGVVVAACERANGFSDNAIHQP